MQKLGTYSGSLQSTSPDEGTIKSLWTKWDNDRKGFLGRCRRCASLTIPSILPPEGATEKDDLPTPWQSIGARCVNNLASKLLLTLLPPNSPFHRLQIERDTLEKLKAELGQEGVKTKVESKLVIIEQQITDYLEGIALRVPAFEAFRALIAVGNAMLFIPDEGGAKTFSVDQYVVRRDSMGNVLDMIIREFISPKVLPDAVKEGIAPEIAKKSQTEQDEDLEIFTHIRRVEGKFEVDQEILGQSISTLMGVSKGSYPVDECPWIPLRLTSIGGEHYGRGMVEEYLGDYLNLEDLHKALTMGSLAAAKVVWFVNPTGVTVEQDVIDAESMDVKIGRSEDVSALQLEKAHDFGTAYQSMQDIERRLAQAFLLDDTIRRNGERVTAEEIRLMAQSLEDTLGGIYSLLATEFQLPLVKRVMALMKRKGRIPSIPETVKPTIIAGLEALGRGHDLNKLMQLLDVLSRVAQVFGPEALGEYSPSELIARAANSLGVDMAGVKIPPEVLEQRQQQAMMQGITQQAAPGVAQEVTKGMVQAATQQNPQPEN